MRRSPIKILLSILMVLSTTIRQNLLAIARLGLGLDNEGLGAAKLTDFTDVTVVVSVPPVPVVLRRSYIELKYINEYCLKFWVL